MSRRKKAESSGWRYEGDAKPVDAKGNESGPEKATGWVRREVPVHRRRTKGGIEIEEQPDVVLNPKHANGHSETGGDQ